MTTKSGSSERQNHTISEGQR